MAFSPDPPVRHAGAVSSARVVTGSRRCYEDDLPWSQAMRWRTLSLASLLLLAGCQSGPSAEGQKLERLELRLQQLERRLAHPDEADTADKGGKPPAGPVKSLTFRMGSADDRLRIYWADGTTSDLPCTKEQSTWACG